MSNHPLAATVTRGALLTGTGHARPPWYSLLAAALAMTMPSSAAHGAPSPPSSEPTKAEQPAPACPEVTLSDDDRELITARHLYDRGDKFYAEQDFIRAVDAWEQMLEILPEWKGRLHAQLAYAHHRAYAMDRDESHLYAARELFSEQLASLSAGDPARVKIEGSLGEIETALAAVAYAKAKAEQQREQNFLEQQRLRDQRIFAEADLKNQRSNQKIYLGVGGSLAALGVGSLAVMTGFLVAGRNTSREGQQFTTMTGIPSSNYEDLIAQGNTQNRVALSTGIVGGVLVLSGASLLIAVAIRNKRVIRPLEKRVSVTTTLGGLHLRF